MDDNVVSLPTKLERLSKRIKKNMEIGHQIRAQWIESKIEMACDLLEARLEFGVDNNRFHDWLVAEGLGDSALPKDDRAALLAMATDPKRMRAIFKASNRWSPQHIFRNEWGSSSRDENPLKKHRRNKPPVKTNEARDFVRAKVDAGEPVSRGSDVSPTVRRAVEYEEGRRDGLAEAQALGAAYTKAQKHHIDMAIKAYQRELNAQFKQHVAKLEAEFEARVQKRFEEAKAAAWPVFEKETEEARLDKVYYRKLIDDYKPPFTVDEYRIIVMALHPDNSASEETRARALQSFTDKKLQLTGKQ